jgi:hypothetical protein
MLVSLCQIAPSTWQIKHSFAARACTNIQPWPLPQKLHCTKMRPSLHGSGGRNKKDSNAQPDYIRERPLVAVIGYPTCALLGGSKTTVTRRFHFLAFNSAVSFN